MPAEVARVWDLLSDPARMPEWEPGTGSVENVPAGARVGPCWIAHAPRARPDGKLLRVKPAHRTARVERCGVR